MGFHAQCKYPEKNKQNIQKHFLRRTGDISTRRLKLWEESFEELLSDPLGRETLQKFLDKEYSGENLRFWWEVNHFSIALEEKIFLKNLILEK